MLRPEDVLLDVFQYLIRYDLDTVTLVCRHYRQLIDSKMLTVCLRPLSNVRFDSFSCHSEEAKEAKRTDSDSGIAYRVEYRCNKITAHYARTLHHTDEFACYSQAIQHLFGVLRYSYVKNLSITLDLFDHALTEAFLELFKSLRAEIVTVRFPEDSVDVLPCPQALVVKNHLLFFAPAEQVSTQLFAAITPLKLSYVVLHATDPEKRAACGSMDDGVLAYIFQQQDWSHLRTNATVSSAFLGTLLRDVDTYRNLA